MDSTSTPAGLLHAQISATAELGELPSAYALSTMTSALLLALVAFALVAQSASPTFERRTFTMPDGSTVRYGLAVPGDYRAPSPRPLVIALHPGGGGTVAV